MKESEDVSKLFAMFDKEKANEYREVYEADQQQATRERWPLFQAIRLGKPNPDKAIVPTTSKPASSTVSSPSPVAPKSEWSISTSIPQPADHVLSSEEGTLQSLFRRLDKSAPGEARPTPRSSTEGSEAGRQADSRPLSSLFKRLSQS